MKIDLTEFYDIGGVTSWKTSTNVTMYDIELISKSTGEVITWSFTEEYFDKLLAQMEEELKEKIRQRALRRWLMPTYKSSYSYKSSSPYYCVTEPYTYGWGQGRYWI